MSSYIKVTAVLVVASVMVYFLTFRSVRQKHRSEIQALRSEISLKDMKIVELENKLYPPKAVPVRSVIQAPGVSPLDLQNALKRAGLYSGPFDGHLTTKVVAALKEFQQRKGLRADGVLGKRTWQLLKES